MTLKPLLVRQAGWLGASEFVTGAGAFKALVDSGLKSDEARYMAGLEE